MDQTKIGLPSFTARLRAFQSEVIQGICRQRSSLSVGLILLQVVLHFLLNPNDRESSDGDNNGLSFRSPALAVCSVKSPKIRNRLTAASNLLTLNIQASFSALFLLCVDFPSKRQSGSPRPFTRIISGLPSVASLKNRCYAPPEFGLRAAAEHCPRCSRTQILSGIHSAAVPYSAFAEIIVRCSRLRQQCGRTPL